MGSILLVNVVRVFPVAHSEWARKFFVFQTRLGISTCFQANPSVSPPDSGPGRRGVRRNRKVKRVTLASMQSHLLCPLFVGPLWEFTDQTRLYVGRT